MLVISLAPCYKSSELNPLCGLTLATREILLQIRDAVVLTIPDWLREETRAPMKLDTKRAKLELFCGTLVMI